MTIEIWYDEETSLCLENESWNRNLWQLLSCTEGRVKSTPIPAAEATRIVLLVSHGAITALWRPNGSLEFSLMRTNGGDIVGGKAEGWTCLLSATWLL